MHILYFLIEVVLGNNGILDFESIKGIVHSFNLYWEVDDCLFYISLYRLLKTMNDTLVFELSEDTVHNFDLYLEIEN